MIWLKNKYKNWNVADNNSTKLENFLEDLLECKKMDTWYIDKDDAKEQLITLQPKNYAELCGAIYSVYASTIKKDFKIWGDKNNFHLNHLNDLLDLFSHARFLHIVRDGRDVACSYLEVMNCKTNSPYAPSLKTNISDIATEWSNNVIKTDCFMRTLPAKRAMTIKYEDLVSEPSKVITSICEWLRIPFEDNMLCFYQENKNKKLEPDMTIDWKKRTLEPISNVTVGRYLNMLNKDERDKFYTLAERALKRFFYSF